ncbi:MAG: DUF3667 domain-containing protein [Deltaproteobacteria bacterium]|jgi:hypothetical protein|nr:DUF3667 domain-containing protein [Deltaproteobacteria bacterium]
MTSQHCKNCLSRYQGQFCPHCGQSSKVRDLDWPFLWNDFRFLLFSYDSSIFLSLRNLLIRPGPFIQDFLAGKRVKAFFPFRLLLTLAGLYTALAVTTKVNLVSLSDSAYPTQSAHQVHVVLNWVVSHYALAEICLVPILAVCTFLTFRKAKLNLAAHTAAAADFVCQMLTIKTVFLIIALALNHRTYFLIATLPMLTSAALIAFTLYQLFPKLPPWERIFRIALNYAMFLSVLSLVLFCILTYLNEISPKQS